MPIRLDSTQISVVVLCTQCPWWRGFAFNRNDGWGVGARHESAIHPGQRQAEMTARASAKRN